MAARRLNRFASERLTNSRGERVRLEKPGTRHRDTQRERFVIHNLDTKKRTTVYANSLAIARRYAEA